MTYQSKVAAELSWKIASTPPRFDDESADGLVARVAGAEYYPRMLDLTEIAGAELTHRAAASRRDPKGIRALAGSLGIDATDLAQRCVIDAAGARRIAFFGASIDLLHIVSRTRRFAPAALLVCLGKSGPFLKRAREGIWNGEWHGTSAVYAGADHREAA